ncbi:hypothetical protein VP01_2876g1 [Puccinia sorghi]|uniref:Uncharacterized protein n=1 Tax=Puccinia sorghi TaxID=27349 RepID=A0A0L6V1Q4_9BASI|nr:hypothetical protein VP01_2876g1 [Puccinia sorghi]
MPPSYIFLHGISLENGQKRLCGTVKIISISYGLGAYKPMWCLDVIPHSLKYSQNISSYIYLVSLYFSLQISKIRILGDSLLQIFHLEKNKSCFIFVILSDPPLLVSESLRQNKIYYSFFVANFPINIGLSLFIFYYLNSIQGEKPLSGQNLSPQVFPQKLAFLSIQPCFLKDHQTEENKVEILNKASMKVTTKFLNLHPNKIFCLRFCMIKSMKIKIKLVVWVEILLQTCNGLRDLWLKSNFWPECFPPFGGENFPTFYLPLLQTKSYHLMERSNHLEPVNILVSGMPTIPRVCMENTFELAFCAPYELVGLNFEKIHSKIFSIQKHLTRVMDIIEMKCLDKEMKLSLQKPGKVKGSWLLGLLGPIIAVHLKKAVEFSVMSCAAVIVILVTTKVRHQLYHHKIKPCRQGLPPKIENKNILVPRITFPMFKSRRFKFNLTISLSFRGSLWKCRRRLFLLYYIFLFCFIFISVSANKILNFTHAE